MFSVGEYLMVTGILTNMLDYTPIISSHHDGNCFSMSTIFLAGHCTDGIRPADSSPTTIPPRYGHSMVLDPNTRILYIFGGQRGEKYLSDMYTYNLNTSAVTELFSNFTQEGGPTACFTQRAVIDADLKEIYV